MRLARPLAWVRRETGWPVRPWEKNWSERTTGVHHRTTDLARRTGREDLSHSMTVGHLGADGEVWEEVGCRVMTPVHLLIAVLETPGPAAQLVARSAKGSLVEAAGLVESEGSSGVSADVHEGQAWSSAQRW